MPVKVRVYIFYNQLHCMIHVQDWFWYYGWLTIARVCDVQNDKRVDKRNDFMINVLISEAI